MNIIDCCERYTSFFFMLLEYPWIELGSSFSNVGYNPSESVRPLIVRVDSNTHIDIANVQCAVTDMPIDKHVAFLTSIVYPFEEK